VIEVTSIHACRVAYRNRQAYEGRRLSVGLDLAAILSEAARQDFSLERHVILSPRLARTFLSLTGPAIGALRSRSRTRWLKAIRSVSIAPSATHENGHFS
jgi:hypothetical protein